MYSPGEPIITIDQHREELWDEERKAIAFEISAFLEKRYKVTLTPEIVEDFAQYVMEGIL